MENNNRMGSCIPSSYEDFTTKFKDLAISNLAFIVHGYVYINGKPIKHAWIDFLESELINTIYEPVNELFLDKDEIVNGIKVSDMFKEVKRYNYIQISKLSIQTKSRGGIFEFDQI